MKKKTKLVIIMWEEMTCMKSLSLPMEMGLYTRVRSAVLSVALTRTSSEKTKR